MSNYKLTDSSVVSFRIFRQHAIVLNTYKAANDLLEVRSSIYSDRPTTTMTTANSSDENLPSSISRPRLHGFEHTVGCFIAVSTHVSSRSIKNFRHARCMCYSETWQPNRSALSLIFGGRLFLAMQLFVPTDIRGL